MRRIYKLSHFLKFFSHRLLQRFGFLPRWIVFGIDLMLLLFACVITFFIINTLSFDPTSSLGELVNKFTLLMSVTAVFFLVFRTYSGLIRHATIIDVGRLLLATVSSFAVLVSINMGCLMFTGQYYFRTATLIIYTMMAFSLLLFFRIFVKQTYDYIYSFNSKNVQRLAILGVNDSSISMGSALLSEKPRRFRLVTFLDTRKKNQSKRILNLPITYVGEEDFEGLSQLKVEAILIPSILPKGINRKLFLNICIENGFKVYVAPVIEDINTEKPLSTQITNIEIEDLLERKPIVLDTKLIKKKIKKKTVLVTGAAGSIGSELAHQLATFKPYELILLDQAESPMFELGNKLNAEFPDLKIRQILADITNYDRMHHVFEQFRPEIVCHAAAYKHVPLMEMNPYEALMTNVFGTKNLADLSIKFLVDRFVMVSTDKAVRPSNVMGASKRIAEIYVQSLNSRSIDHHTKFITTRFGNVLGSNGSVVPIFKEQITQGGPVTITHPDIIRYFMTIKEACQLVLEAGAMGSGGEIFIFDMGEPVRIMDLAEKMIRLSGYKPFVDIDIKITGLRPGEKLYEELLNDKATTHPTYNEKIMIATERSYGFDEVTNQIQELYALVSSHQDLVKMVSKMKEIVPEFISQNSVFQSLDLKNTDL
ncbi:MAG: polysaccharide biosynthesis protein [Bacteroidetes bacterium]|nr:polysaccharide biosynthesis protein [Bacteroidota bacterium]